MAKLAAAMAGIAVLSAAGWPGPLPPRSASPGITLLTVRPAVSGSHRLQPDFLVVSARPLPAGAAAAVSRLRGVRASETVDAAKIQVNGKYVQMLGVDPATFRPFAARPTASSQTLWRSVADGQLAVSYLMGKQDKLPVGATAQVAGHKQLPLRIGGIGTVGIAGVDAVVSRTVAQVLGFPVGNAMVVSAPHANLGALKARLTKLLPKAAQVQVLVAAPGRQADSTAGAAGSVAAPASQARGGLTSARILTMLRAAYSRVGMPYVWGAAGPTSFDCSGLVQWSFAQAGIVMPRVAADQARTGPAVRLSQLQPGDLLFYHTDPTAPGYISHVAIYLGRGEMIQAPEPGMNVEVVPADFGSEFAGAVAVAPAIAAQVAGVPVG
jgi:cell wall-associated NlpC family hydrolase